MGIIKRQGIKQSIVTYLGVIVGFASTIWIYPLDEDIYGVARFLLAAASFLGAFAFLGVTSWSIRFFSVFQNEKNGHNGFLSILLSASNLAFILFMGLLYFLKTPFLDMLGFLNMQPDRFQDNFIYVAILTYLLVMASLMSAYISNFQRIVAPELLTNFFIKVSLPILVLGYYFDYLGTVNFIVFLIIVHLLVLIGLFAYAAYLGQLKLNFNWRFLKRPLLKEMTDYALFSILGAVGSQMATRLDLIMIGALLPDIKSVTIYALALNLASVIEVPYRAFNKIASPIIARQNEANNKTEVLDIYQRSSIGLLIAGLLIFLAVWVSIDQIFLLATNPAPLLAGKSVVLYLGLAKIIDMATGINGQIIAYSKYYRVNVIAISILAIINVMTNYYLIPLYGINGAALATLISLATFNIFKFLYVWVVFKMQPFTWDAAKVLFLAGVCFLMATLIPSTPIALINIMIKSGLYGLLFTSGVLYFNFSNDLTQLFNEFWEKVKGLRR